MTTVLKSALIRIFVVIVLDFHGFKAAKLGQPDSGLF